MSGYRVMAFWEGQKYSRASESGHYLRFKAIFSNFLGLGIHALINSKSQMTQIYI